MIGQARLWSLGGFIHIFVLHWSHTPLPSPALHHPLDIFLVFPPHVPCALLLSPHSPLSSRDPCKEIGSLHPWPPFLTPAPLPPPASPLPPPAPPPSTLCHPSLSSLCTSLPHSSFLPLRLSSSLPRSPSPHFQYRIPAHPFLRPSLSGRPPSGFSRPQALPFKPPILPRPPKSVPLPTTASSCLQEAEVQLVPIQAITIHVMLCLPGKNGVCSSEVGYTFTRSYVEFVSALGKRPASLSELQSSQLHLPLATAIVNVGWQTRVTPAVPGNQIVSRLFRLISSCSQTKN